MSNTERALRTLCLGTKLGAARIAAELQRTAEQLGAAARREARLADRHAAWCEALRACLATAPIDTRRAAELDQRRHAALGWLERARGETRQLSERDRALRIALTQEQRREEGLRGVARTLQADERARRAEAASHELEDAWNARPAGAGE